MDRGNQSHKAKLVQKVEIGGRCSSPVLFCRVRSGPLPSMPSLSSSWDDDDILLGALANTQRGKAGSWQRGHAAQKGVSKEPRCKQAKQQDALSKEVIYEHLTERVQHQGAAQDPPSLRDVTGPFEGNKKVAVEAGSVQRTKRSGKARADNVHLHAKAGIVDLALENDDRVGKTMQLAWPPPGMQRARAGLDVAGGGQPEGQRGRTL